MVGLWWSNLFIFDCFVSFYVLPVCFRIGCSYVLVVGCAVLNFWDILCYIATLRHSMLHFNVARMCYVVGLVKTEWRCLWVSANYLLLFFVRNISVGWAALTLSCEIYVVYIVLVQFFSRCIVAYRRSDNLKLHFIRWWCVQRCCVTDMNMIHFSIFMIHGAACGSVWLLVCWAPLIGCWLWINS